MHYVKCGFHPTQRTQRTLLFFCVFGRSVNFLAFGLRGEGQVWQTGAVVCLLAAPHGTYCSQVRTMDGGTVCCGITSSCQSAAASKIVKRFWSRVWLLEAALCQVPDFHVFTFQCIKNNKLIIRSTAAAEQLTVWSAIHFDAPAYVVNSSACNSDHNHWTSLYCYATSPALNNNLLFWWTRKAKAYSC